MLFLGDAILADCHRGRTGRPRTPLRQLGQRGRRHVLEFGS